jgi:Tfp pilus assembly protein PilF
MRVRFRAAAAAVIVVLGIQGCDRTTAQEHLDRAQRYVAEGDVRSATIELKSALQKDPNLGAARL